jgi:anthranilate phosphoribosyltransferase
MAGALAQLGVERALLVAGEDGLDEVSASAPTRVLEVNGPEISEYVLRPEEVGVAGEFAAGPEGGTPAENAAVTRAILDVERDGRERPPGEELAVINAGAAIYAAGSVATIADGVDAARAALADGSAATALAHYVAASRRHAPQEARS